MKTRIHIVHHGGPRDAAVADARGARFGHPTSGSGRAPRRRAVDDLLAEHRQLRSAVEALETRLASPPRSGGDGWAGALAHELDALGVALADHFTMEEARGLLVAIGEAGPSGSAAAPRLQREHARLLREVDRLRKAVRRPGGGRASRRAWVHRSRALLAALRDHEEREAGFFDAVERVEAALE